MMKYFGVLRRSFIVFLLIVFYVLAWSGSSYAGPVRIDLMVDNSGSMYGRCGRGEICQDIMPEVKRAMSIILELLHAYNQERPPEQRLEMVLTLFGGVHNGVEEFEEIKLGPDLKQNLAAVNQRLVPEKSKYFQKTDFSLAFRKTLDVLKSRGKADLTIFLTDAVSGGSSDAGASMDLSYFGTTYLYSLMKDTSALAEWQKHFEAQNLQANTIHIERGWQILSSFAMVFLKLLVPEGQDQYLSYEEQDLLAGNANLQLRKITKAKAVYYVIFHGSETPQLERVELEGAPLDKGAFSGYSGTNLLRLEFPEGMSAGTYKLVLTPMRQTRKTAVIGIENVSLILVDRQNPIEKQNVYKRNEEVSLNFGFASEEYPNKPVFSEAQEKAFLDIVNFSFEVQEQNGKDKWIRPDKEKVTKYVRHFHPSSNEDAVYNILTEWSYLEKNPKAARKVGSFVISKHAGQELALEFTSKHGELWQGLDIRGRATFVQASSLPQQLRQTNQVTIRDQQTKRLYVLKRTGNDLVFEGSLGRQIEPGLHTFELVEPSPSGPPEIVLSGREMKVKPRQIVLSLRETFSRQDPQQEEFFSKLRDGFKYLWDEFWGKSEEGVSHRTEDIMQFPMNKDVLIQYYDKDAYHLEVQSRIEPVFHEENIDLELQYHGPRSFAAEKAYTPGFMGLFQGKAQEVKDALTIDVSPELSKVKLGDSLKLSLNKKKYDWEIQEPLAPKPELSYQFVLSEGNERVTLAPASIILNIKTRPYDKEIITGLRLFAFFAALAFVLFWLLLFLAFAIACRGHVVRRQEICCDIMKRVPEDFCDTGPHRKCAFPDASMKLLKHEASKRKLQKQAAVLHEAIERNDSSLLKKVWSRFKMSQLKELLAQCKAKNLNSTWEFQVSAGRVVTLYGSELNTAASAVRLRDQDLPPIVGQLKVQNARASTFTGMLEVWFTVGPELVVKHNENVHIPPVRQDIEIKHDDVLFIGPNKNELRLKLRVNMRDDTLIVMCQEL